MTKRQRGNQPRKSKIAHAIEQLQRRRGVRSLPKRLLIVCEDDKSSPNYFRTLLRHFRLDASRVEIVRSGGDSQPIQVVEKAIEYSNLAKKSEGTEPFDEAWCVIDGDYGNKITNARKKATASRNKVRLAVSTPCFDYWLLLHFEETAKPTAKCIGTIKYLKKHVKLYEKGKQDFSSFMGRVLIAQERARKLRNATVSGQEYPESQNPCSELYLLIDALDLS